MKRFLIGLLCLVLALSMVGCKEDKNSSVPEDGTYRVFYLSGQETHVIAHPYESDTEDPELLAKELFGQLKEVPQVVEYEPIPDGFEICDWNIVESQMVIDLNEQFRELNTVKATLVRAALVRTMTQIEGVDTVSFTIEGEALADGSGQIIGPMNADQFIDNAGNEINAYERANLVLYFADESGNYLKKVTQTVVYNSNISVEKLVVEQLLSGPSKETSFATINPMTKLLSVTVQDGVCYVNLDSGFLTAEGTVSPEVAVYSIVNSLVELSNINKVQILIDGENNLTYREKVALSVPLERNLELVQ